VHRQAFLEPVSHLLPGGIRGFIQQGLAGNDEAGRTESALGTAVNHPGSLERVQVVRGADPFDGRDRCIIRYPFHFCDTGPYQLVIENHIAGTALAFAASHLDAREKQAFPEHGGQPVFFIDDQGSGDTVNSKIFFDHASLLFKRW
jgi:hypothetical protein